MAEQNLTQGDLTDEVWREYDFGGRVYVIKSPVRLYFRPGGTTHRVLDANGIVHCVPAPGERGCVLRWLTAPGKPPVAF